MSRAPVTNKSPLFAGTRYSHEFRLKEAGKLAVVVRDDVARTTADGDDAEELCLIESQLNMAIQHLLEATSRFKRLTGLSAGMGTR